MSKGLEALKELKYFNACCRCQYYIDKQCTNKDECCYMSIEKELKALEIIKNKSVDVFWFQITAKERKKKGYPYGADRYNEHKAFKAQQLTQKEYDLLKEVLL